VERPDIFNQVVVAFLLDQSKAGSPR
jgi:hypothetical protein